MLKKEIYIVQEEVRVSSRFYPVKTQILDVTNLTFCNKLEVAWKFIEDRYALLIKDDYACEEINEVVISNRFGDNYVYIRSYSHLIESDLEIIYRIVSRKLSLC